MYAFGPLPKQKRSGRVIGTHQKIDRIARRILHDHLTTSHDFPGIMDILHFEGSRGPDAIKMKSPNKDEPWHFINPEHMPDDSPLFLQIQDHSYNLTQALINKNPTRAAFEAAWLAHAVTDGLTPAHHEPFEEQVKVLRASGERLETFSGRIVMTGHGSRRQFVRNNWQYWGAKGVMTTHTLFEAGVAMTAKPLTFNNLSLRQSDIEDLAAEGFIGLYKKYIESIYSLDMYDEFKKYGWTGRLARVTKNELLPTVITAVVLAWYDAYERSKQ